MKRAAMPAFRPVPPIALFFLLLLALIASRAPFLQNTLLGEEGIFAALVLSPKPSSAEAQNGLPQQLVAEVDGHPIFQSFAHPIVPYLVLERGVGILGRATHALDREFSTRNMVARGCYFILFTVGSLGLLWRGAVAWVDPRAAAPKFVIPAVVVYVLTTPLLLGASIQPQVDGSVGVLLMGLAAFVLVARPGSNNEATAFLVAGMLIGLGRIEWVFAFAVAALVTTAALGVLIPQPPLRLPLLLLLGLLAGSAISYLASPPDYLDGLNLMRGIGLGSNGSFRVAFQQRSLLVPVLAFAAIAGVGCAVWRRSLLARASGTIILSLGGIGVILGFAASNWQGDGFPRYYAPVLIALAFVIIDLACRVKWTSRGRAAITVLIVLGVGANLNFSRSRLARDLSISTYPGAELGPLRAQMAASARRSRDEKVIMFENASIWIYYPDTSFVGRDFGVEGARALLAERNPADVTRLRMP